MKSKNFEAKKVFTEQLTEQTKAVNPEFVEVAQMRLVNLISVDVGQKILQGFLSNPETSKNLKQSYSPVNREMFLFSLIEKIPEQAKDLIFTEIGIKGIHFYRDENVKMQKGSAEDEDEEVIEEEGDVSVKKVPVAKKSYIPPATNPLHMQKRKPRVLASYKPEVMSLLEPLILPRQVNIEKEMADSENHFLNGFNDIRFTEALIKRNPELNLEGNDSFIKFLREEIFLPEDADILNRAFVSFPTSKPLHEVVSGKDVSSVWRINSRDILNYVLMDSQMKIPDDCEFVLFHHNGLFYLDGKEVKVISATEKYLKFFYFSDPDLKESHEKRLNKVRASGQNVDEVRKYVKKFIESVFKIKMPEAEKKFPIDMFVKWINENIKMEFDNGYFESSVAMRDPRNIDAFRRILLLVKDLLPRFFSKLDFERKDFKQGVDIKDDPRKTYIDLNNLFNIALRPKDFERFLGNYSGTTFTFHENNIEYAAKNPQYDHLLIGEIVMHIVKKIINERDGSYKKQYDGMKNKFIGGARLEREKNELQAYGYSKYAPITEYAVVFKYLIEFGIKYIINRLNPEKKNQFPPEVEEYFDELFFGIVKKKGDLPEAI